MANNSNPSNSDLQFPSDPAGDIDPSLQPVDERVDSAALRFPSFDDAPTPKHGPSRARTTASTQPSTSEPSSPTASADAAPTSPAQPQAAAARAETQAMPTFTFANSNTEAPMQAMPASAPSALDDDAASDDFNVPVWGAAEGSAAAADDEQTELFPPAPTPTSVNTHTQVMQDGATTATLPPITPHAGPRDGAGAEGTRVLGRTASSYTNTVIRPTSETAPASFDPLEEVADEDDGAERDPEPDNGRHGRGHGAQAGSGKKRIVIAVIAALIVVALIVVGVVLWQRGKSADAKDAALASCRRSQQLVQTVSATLDKEVKADGSLASTSQDAVADASTVTKFADALQQATALQKDTQGVDQMCATSLSQPALEQAARKLDAQATQIEDATKSLRDAASAVNASKDARTKSDGVRKDLQSAIDEAQTLYDESAGLVVDEATREALQQAIDDAKKAVSDAGLTQEAADKARDALRAAGDTVRASEDALTAANAAAAEAQRQQELQNATNGTQQQPGLNGAGDATGTVNGGTGDATGTTTGGDTTGVPTVPTVPSTGDTGTTTVPGGTTGGALQ
ncbi:hypothetical protein B1400_1455 [Bifidobacterium italicum]|uniref:Sugar-binding protein n=1 Tax=Bifidobacterium italicum TaxID=1960968 RepID=A0A2A2EGP8_9BIFI|nr:hypothetical protein [Bifidobacterium italicum]PAU68142.1 hypothetical protein B1400_1455 [Bifidobacterium italicum]